MSRYGTGLFSADAYDDGISRFAQIRQDFATALTDGHDLIGYTEEPAAPQPGDCWAQLVGMEAAGPAGVFMSTWHVYVICGQAPEDAVRFLERHVDVIPDLICMIAYVRSVSLVTVNDLHAVEYRAVRE